MSSLLGFIVRKSFCNSLCLPSRRRRKPKLRQRKPSVQKKPLLLQNPPLQNLLSRHNRSKNSMKRERMMKALALVVQAAKRRKRRNRRKTRNPPLPPRRSRVPSVR